MGIYIYLKILPNDIESDAWNGIYKETLHFLQNHPNEIMGIDEDVIGKQTRMVYSRRLEHQDERQNGRFWRVEGDYHHRQFAESFVMRDRIQYYQRNMDTKNEQPLGIDILSIEAQHDCATCYTVFSDKTQGYGYHLPMLAVAMLVENAFPRYALVGGDIDRNQAQEAQEIVQKILGKTIALPVRVDGRRLFERLLGLFPEEEAIQHFNTLFLGNDSESFQMMLQHHSQNAGMQMFLDRLQHYQNPTQLGAIDLFISWLNATGDVATLIDMVCIDDNGPSMDPVELASGLVSTWVSIEPSNSQSMNMFSLHNGVPQTVASQFGHVLLDLMGAKGRNIQRYIPQADILDPFQKRFPNNFSRIQKVFCQKEKKLKEEQKELAQCLDTIQQSTSEDPPDPGADALITTQEPSQLSPTQNRLIDQLADGIKKLEGTFTTQFHELALVDWKKYQQSIIWAAKEQGIVLTEDAWKWIDAEQDLTRLRFLLILVAINSHESTFWDIRKGIIENKSIFSEFVNRCSAYQAEIAE